MASQLFMDLPSGYKIPVVGLGTSKANETDVENSIEAALEIGYRHIDTAFFYNNEHIIGRILKKWFEAGKLKREDVFITSKLPVFATGPEDVEKYLLKSLEILQLEYLDLFLIHFPVFAFKKEGESKWTTLKTDHIAIWKKMEQQVDAGRTRSLGVSNFNKRQIERIIKSNPKHKISNLQIEIQPYLQQRDLVEYCHKNSITVTAYGPLGSPGYNNFLVSLGHQAKELPNILNDSTIKRIAQKHNKTTAQVILRFHLQNNIIVIPKTVTISRLKENIDLFDFNLDEVDIKDLRSLDIGEDARVFNFIEYPGFEDNPEWPFKKYQTTTN